MDSKEEIQPRPSVIEGATLSRIPRDGKLYPAAIIADASPQKGEILRLRLGGVVYIGAVLDWVESGGKTLVEFQDGLKPDTSPPDPAEVVAQE